MTLDELKKLAEAAGTRGWFTIALPGKDARFIAAMSPAITLKLLEMIEVLRGGLGDISAGRALRGSLTNPPAIFHYNLRADMALTHADKIERSLNE